VLTNGWNGDRATPAGHVYGQRLKHRLRPSEAGRGRANGSSMRRRGWWGGEAISHDPEEVLQLLLNGSTSAERTETGADSSRSREVSTRRKDRRNGLYPQAGSVIGSSVLGAPSPAAVQLSSSESATRGSACDRSPCYRVMRYFVWSPCTVSVCFC